MFGDNFTRGSWLSFSKCERGYLRAKCYQISHSQSTMDWKNDKKLAEEIKMYVRQNLRRSEILDFIQRDYSYYRWSLTSLDRRMRYFNIKYIDETTTLDAVKDAVRAELDGPGKLLGYRAMAQKLRTQHHLNVPRHLVRSILADLDPDGVSARKLQKKTSREKGSFTSKGPLWVVSVDGHDKLCGYQNWTFPLGIYGFIDTFSRRILSLSVVMSNSDPLVVGKLYISMLQNLNLLPRFLRMDKGTETGKMATIHSYLMSHYDFFEDPTDSVCYGSSTTNKIERWWRDLHERLEKYFKSQLKELLYEQEYDPHNDLHRQMLAFVYVPVLQRECDIFVRNWNNHRIRRQKDLELPTGIPNHLFSFPEKYGAERMGIPLEFEQLQEVAELAGIPSDQDTFTENDSFQMFKQYISNPEKIERKDANKFYVLLKNALKS